MGLPEGLYNNIFFFFLQSRRAQTEKASLADPSTPLTTHTQAATMILHKLTNQGNNYNKLVVFVASKNTLKSL